jgi:hypothetical protein
MKDISLDIVKEDKYYLKSPFDGQIIDLFIDDKGYVEKGQIIAILKTRNFYVEIESEFSGAIRQVRVEVNQFIKKWEDILVVDISKGSILDEFTNIATSVNSYDYGLIYTFQQEIIPKLIYNETSHFLKGISLDKEGFIYFLFKEVYDNNKMDIPFSRSDFRITEEIIDDNIIMIKIDWPNIDRPLLTRTSYILIDETGQKIQYFTCEKSLNHELMISSILYVGQYLTRYNYGPAPANKKLEKEYIVDIFTMK